MMTNLFSCLNTVDYGIAGAWFAANWLWVLPLLIWSLIWKGLALWRAAGLKDKVWFIALLVVNTVGILEIFYIYFFSKRKEGSQ